MDTEIDFTKFVEFLDREAEQKKQVKRAEEITDNRRRVERGADYRHENIRWGERRG